MKGKKAIARSRATINDVSNIMGTSDPQAADKLFFFASSPNQVLTDGISEQRTSTKL